MRDRAKDFLGCKGYYLNCFGNSGGPYIFGKRLKTEFKKLGWIYDPKVFDYNLAFASGKYWAGKVNVLRLDGLYFDTGNTLGDSRELNAPIQKAYGEFDKIIFQSRFAQEMHFRYFGEVGKPHKIIYNGVPRDFSPSGEKYKYPFAKTLICSSKWRTHKRLAAIVEGLRALKDKAVGLVILGNFGVMDQQPAIKEQEDIIYLGHVPPQKLPFYLRGADAFVHLSWLDWCPNVVVEALACGLPVLCGHNGGTRELVKDSGVILELEETYDYRPVALYEPPMPDPKLVARGMSEILEWNKPIVRPDLYMDSVAKQYVDFILEQ